STFHRVIKGFMIQGGSIKHDQSWDTLSFEARTLENEIMDKHKHKYGALAAARVGNPEKRSDISQFYIVENHSGAHYLDNNYTVFGQLLIGFNVLDSIVNQKMNGSSPVIPIKMEVKAEKVKRADMIKFYGDIY
ncbi:MAG: peptidylprolyl isomerase, partial [Bacteroidetes bacterium]